MNGWFPKINSRGDIVSGSTEVWITYADGSQVQIASDGGGAHWLTDDSIIYNHTDGSGTTIWPSMERCQGYNYLTANGAGKWAGGKAGSGGVDVYEGSKLVRSIDLACQPKFDGDILAYLTPYQDPNRQLIVNEASVVSGPVVDYVLGSPIMALIASGTYTKGYTAGVTINPTVGGPVRSGDWICENAGSKEGLFVHPWDSYEGYFLADSNWFYHDFRVINGVLIVAASTSSGNPRIARIDPASPRIDLRTVGQVATPVPVPKPTPIPEVPPVSTPIENTPSSWPDSMLMDEIQKALAQARSTDDASYWFNVMRHGEHPSTGPDWLYWQGRIFTGDGAGKAVGPVPTPVPTPAPTPLPIPNPIPGLPASEVTALIEKAISEALGPIEGKLNTFSATAADTQAKLTNLIKDLSDGIRTSKAGYGPLSHSHVLQVVV